MRPADRICLALLIVDGLLVGLLTVGFAYLRIDGVLAPIAAVVAGVANSALLWLAAGYTASPLRYAPLLAWVLVVVVAVMPGPGGDIALATAGSSTGPTLLLLGAGLGLPLLLAWFRRLPTPSGE